jgi:3-phenylpropionate/trans-cinnamate dioxygenase ferredoxin subunit
MVWKKVCDISSLPQSGLTRAEVDGQELLVVSMDGKYFVTQLRCTHEQDDLSNGMLENGNIVCGFHYATFNPASGEVVSQPQDGGEATPLKTYSVKIEAGELLVDL